MVSGGKVTTVYGQMILDRLTDDSSIYSLISKGKAGIGTTSAAEGDTDLETAIPFSGTEAVDSCDVTTSWVDSADMTLSVNSTTYKEGGKSLNLTKDAGAAAEASTTKPTTSVDGTSKDFHMWLYVINAAAQAKLATSNAFEVRFGSSAAAYYKYQLNNSELSTGWNLIKLAIPSGFDSTVGAPVIAALDYTFVALTATTAATTWSAGDFIMDDIKLASAGDYLHAFDSGYPSVDSSTLQITYRVAILSTEANGYPITEAGFFNTDTSAIMSTRDVFNPISKSSTDEIVIVSKDILTLNG